MSLQNAKFNGCKNLGVYSNSGKFCGIGQAPELLWTRIYLLTETELQLPGEGVRGCKKPTPLCYFFEINSRNLPNQKKVLRNWQKNPRFIVTSWYCPAAWKHPWISPHSL
jgi:hypothetical protein